MSEPVGKTRSQVDAELQLLYDQVPEIPDCDGRCWRSCGPIDMSARERQRIRAAGVRITPGEEAMLSADTFWCEALVDGRCSVYDVRPMVCRLWGATEDLPCPFGCVPESGNLAARDAVTLLAQSIRVGGGGPVELQGMPDEEFMAAIGSDLFQRIMAANHARGRRGMQRRIDGTIPPAFRKAKQ